MEVPYIGWALTTESSHQSLIRFRCSHEGRDPVVGLSGLRRRDTRAQPLRIHGKETVNVSELVGLSYDRTINLILDCFVSGTLRNKHLLLTYPAQSKIQEELPSASMRVQGQCLLSKHLY